MCYHDNMSDEQTQAEIDTAVYLEHRKGLIALGNDQIKEFDKAILTLSAGALALSITFVKEIAGGRAAALVLHYIAVGWAFFTAAIILNIISYYLSWKDTTLEVRRIDSCMLENKPYNYARNHYRTITSALNVIAFICFLCGVGFVGLFSYSNLAKPGV